MTTQEEMQIEYLKTNEQSKDKKKQFIIDSFHFFFLPTDLGGTRERKIKKDV